jgi:hypothetical protein
MNSPLAPIPLGVFKDEKGEEKSISWQQVIVTLKSIPRSFWALLMMLTVAYLSFDEVMFRLYEADWLEGCIHNMQGPSLTDLAGESDDMVCVVVRFGAEQVTNEKYNLVHTIDSIVAQDHTNWEMVLIATDNGDISAASRLVKIYEPAVSARLRLYQLDWAVEKYDPTQKARFHAKVYRFTDYAISKCSAGSKWVLVTNGDNTYKPSFMSYLNPSYDIVAFDFYSRWYMDKSKFKPCDRLAAVHYEDKDRDESTYPEPRYIPDTHKALSSCLTNYVRKAATDLGANVINLRKWNAEGRKYYKIHSIDGSQDGFMMNNLRNEGWKMLSIGGSFNPDKIRRQTAEEDSPQDGSSGSGGGINDGDGGGEPAVGAATVNSMEGVATDGNLPDAPLVTTPQPPTLVECLFDHNPNYHSCLSLGPQWIWDDSSLDCITAEKAEALLAIGRYVRTSTPVERCIREEEL